MPNYRQQTFSFNYITSLAKDIVQYANFLEERYTIIVPASFFSFLRMRSEAPMLRALINGGTYQKLFEIFRILNDAISSSTAPENQQKIAFNFIEKLGHHLLSELIEDILKKSNDDLSKFEILFSGRLNTVLIPFYDFACYKAASLSTQTGVKMPQPNFLWPHYLAEKEKCPTFKAALSILLKRAEDDKRNNTGLNLYNILTQANNTGEYGNLCGRDYLKLSLAPGSNKSADVGCYDIWKQHSFFYSNDRLPSGGNGFQPSGLSTDPQVIS